MADDTEGFVINDGECETTTKSPGSYTLLNTTASKYRQKRTIACCAVFSVILLICLCAVVISWIRSPVCNITPVAGRYQNSQVSIVGCANDISINLSVAASPIKVTWKEPNAVDNTGSQISILNKTHQPGSSFSANSTTTVKYVFNDTVKSECSFNIDINVEKIVASSNSYNCESNISIRDCAADFIHDEPAYCGTVPVLWTEPTAIGCSGAAVTTEKSHEPGSEFAAGTTTVNYTFADLSQNVKACTFDVIVPAFSIEEDVVAPKVYNCPDHVYKVLDQGETSISIWWEPPTAKDDSERPVTVQQSHSPGHEFTAGGYELVLYNFLDASGNEALCEFAVTVYMKGSTIDMDPPSLSGCPNDNVLVNVPAESSSGNYNVVWPSAIDNDGLSPTVVATHQEGVQAFPAGRTRVRIYYYDSSGNRAACAFTVNVGPRDSNKPTISNCPLNVYREIPEGTSTRVCWDEPTATDNSGIPVILDLKSHQSGTEFFINGCNVVKYYFYDTSGNRQICAFSVTVKAIGHNDLPGEWTRWYDRDSPSGNCDCEHIGPNVHHDALDTGHSAPCTTGEPIDIQCETRTGQDWMTVGLIPSLPEKKGQVLSCCPTGGLYCYNRWNAIYHQQCLDYRVRFKCSPA